MIVPSVPIRVKIIGLLAAALAISLLSYTYVGSSLIVNDKISYIYDYNLAQLRSVADSVDHQISKADSMLRWIASLQAGAADSKTRVAAALSRQGKEVGLEAVLLLSPTADGRFEPLFESGSVRSTLAELGWTPSAFQQSLELVGTVASGLLPIGVAATTADGRAVDAVGLVRVRPDLSQLPGDMRLHLVDTLGRTVAATPDLERSLDMAALGDFEKTLAAGRFGTGVRDQKIGAQNYIVGYRRVLGEKLTLVGLIPREIAFEAARALAARTAALGLSILLVAVGFAFVVVRRMTVRLRQMWLATQKVAQGDFSVRVDATGRSRDEITGLASSFNSMADKIDDLMAQTAEKARMEKELETAQALQTMFFPPNDFSHANILVSGKAIPASECAGDWWHYSQVGDTLIVAVGDVTGHGVSSALVTAAAHGAFSMLARQMRENPRQTPSLKALVRQLNASVYATANGNSTMTLFASIIDLRTGVMTFCNAAHCPTYVYRRRPGDDDMPGLKRVTSLFTAKGPALGHAETLDIDTDTFRLAPGDLVLWYTDGLLDIRLSDETRMSKGHLFDMLAKLADTPGADAHRVCEGLLSGAMEFFGSNEKNRADDITIVVGTIPRTAAFAGGADAAEGESASTGIEIAA